jgi:ubiquinone/menaquinone biosynthesis C-methylase UbiE
VSARRPATHIAAVCGDAMLLPFASQSFDAVFVSAVFGEVPDAARCIAEIGRVLRPNGELVVAEIAGDDDFIPLAKLRGIVEAAGFRFVAKSGLSRNYVARFDVRA